MENIMKCPVLFLSFPLFIYHSIFNDPISMTAVVSISSTKSWHGVTQWSNTLYITFYFIWKANEYWYNEAWDRCYIMGDSYGELHTYTNYIIYWS